MGNASDGDHEFGEVLSELKERGCTALLVGDATDEALDAVCTNFLGGRGDRRARVLALVDREVSVARRRVQRAGPGFEPAIVVDAMPDPPRAATAGVDLSDRTLAVRRTEQSLDALEAELDRALHDARQLHGPFQPGELRVGVESLRPLAEHSDLDRLAAFLHEVTDAIAAEGGMGHFVFPGGRTDDAVRSLSSAFDVVIEFRHVNDRVEHRWTFRDYDVHPEWMQV